MAIGYLSGCFGPGWHSSDKVLQTLFQLLKCVFHNVLLCSSGFVVFSGYFDFPGSAFRANLLVSSVSVVGQFYHKRLAHCARTREPTTLTFF